MCVCVCVYAVGMLRRQQILGLVQVVGLARGQLCTTRMLYQKYHQLQHAVAARTLAPDGRSISQQSSVHRTNLLEICL